MANRKQGEFEGQKFKDWSIPDYGGQSVYQRDAEYTFHCKCEAKIQLEGAVYSFASYLMEPRSGMHSHAGAWERAETSEPKRLTRDFEHVYK